MDLFAKRRLGMGGVSGFSHERNFESATICRRTRVDGLDKGSILGSTDNVTLGLTVSPAVFHARKTKCVTPRPALLIVSEEFISPSITFPWLERSTVYHWYDGFGIPSALAWKHASLP